MKKWFVNWLVIIAMGGGCFAERLSERVNVFLGSASSAQCSPAAIRPFGMISPGPFNAPHVPCGYNNNVEELIGFNHTHLQGTGCGSYGVLVLLPVAGEKELGAKVPLAKKQQSGEPGYFMAELGQSGIVAEMTCAKRAAIHRYTYPRAEEGRVLIDLGQGALYCGEAEVSGNLVHHGDRALSGSVTTTAWSEHTTWFYMEFSKAIDLLDHGDEGGIAVFSTTAGEAVQVKVGISYVSAENARLNLELEIPDWDFDGVRSAAAQEWEKQLAMFEVTGGTRDQQVNFYTAVYHAMFHPQLASDVNNEYRGLDGSVHKTAGHNHYTVLSTWDTFRAAHPLYTLVAPDLQLNVIKTMLDDFRDCGWGPRWKLGPKEVFCMPGSWCDVIIPDAYIKGITDFDTEQAWNLVYKNATVPHDKSRGRRDFLDDYLKYGYVTYPNYINASRTLEHAYCDFSIARFAEALGKKDQVAPFDAKAKNYKKLWDPETRFFRGKDKEGNWSYPDSFDPLAFTGHGNRDYCEGNAWQWLWHVMQDTQGLINLMGGDAALEARLDEFLTAQGGRHSSELFGQYWHGNEPDQHAIYAYNYVGAPAKAAKQLRLVLEHEYRNDTWGISGNEDAGQMSAWYIFSAMGFYPYLHAVPEYAIGSPIFDEVKLNLPNGKTCVIRAKNNSALNIYVQSMKINGKAWDNTWLLHDAIVNGGTIEFVMGPEPSAWGTSPEARPFSMTQPSK